MYSGHRYSLTWAYLSDIFGGLLLNVLNCLFNLLIRRESSKPQEFQHFWKTKYDSCHFNFVATVAFDNKDLTVGTAYGLLMVILFNFFRLTWKRALVGNFRIFQTLSESKIHISWWIRLHCFENSTSIHHLLIPFNNWSRGQRFANKNRKPLTYHFLFLCLLKFQCPSCMWRACLFEGHSPIS